MPATNIKQIIWSTVIRYQFVVVAVIGLALMSLPGVVRAEPIASDPVKLHCIAELPSRARAACQNPDNITHAKNTATHHCKKEPVASGANAKCVTKLANKYIDQANDKPRNPSDFKKKLDAVLKKAGGDPNEPAAESGHSTTDNSADCKDKKDSTCGNCPDDSCVDPAAITCTQQNCDVIDKYLNPAINLFSLVFGLIVAASMIAGGIQYSASAGDSQKVTLAKKRIFNTLLALLAYIFLYAFLQFLVPGGIFKRGY